MFDRPLDCLATLAAGPDAGEQAPPGSDGSIRLVHPVTAQSLQAQAEMLGVAGWVEQSGFKATSGEIILLPGDRGIAAALVGVGDEAVPPGPYAYAGLATALPAGNWRIAAASPAPAPALSEPALSEEDAVLGFCLGAYRFNRFRTAAEPGPRLIVRDEAGLGAAQARAVWLARDLINMPANWLGPRELAEAASDVCRRFGAEVAIIEGEALTRGYPAIAAVGRGSARSPRVFSSRWKGSAAAADSPLLTLVGKGVCFDTGGYDLKPSAGMLRMKKDMGGAAIMLGVARLIMERDLPVRLRLLLGCVENSVSGDAMRPSDVIATRKGLHVEIGNTDAEGRLVLCDLLTEACEEIPTFLIDAATLTGAARVALGPDLPALFSNDERLAHALLEGGIDSWDPLWRLPLHAAYASWLSSPVADLNNVSSKPMAGAVTAALFLQHFVTTTTRWAHIDTYGWNDQARPGRQEGGEVQGMRAVFSGLLRILNL